MFEGALTALVTPFDAHGAVDYEALQRLVERQIEEGIHGLVPVGTTGESPTLAVDEHNRVIETVIEAAAGRVPVIAGTGANATAEAVDLTRHAREAGADGTLQVTPYYNKPNQEGLYRHFCAVAEVGLPVVLYNVPGRTGRAIEIDTVVRLAAHEGVVAIKEAGGSVDRVSAILDRCDIVVLSGDDPLALPMTSVGARGVISVASNVVPGPVARMMRAALDGNWSEAQSLHAAYYPLFCAMFYDTNPIPVKTAMAMMGLLPEVFRLPLCGMDDRTRERLKTVLAERELV